MTREAMVEENATAAAVGDDSRPELGSVELELVGVNKVYQARRGRVEALRDVNLSIRRGEFVS
ncbi:hypothetical protein ABGB07_46170, partial [Micromonosporaceae bacterium B7E4]